MARRGPTGLPQALCGLLRFALARAGVTVGAVAMFARHPGRWAVREVAPLRSELTRGHTLASTFGSAQSSSSGGSQTRATTKFRRIRGLRSAFRSPTASRRSSATRQMLLRSGSRGLRGRIPVIEVARPR